MAIGTHLRVGLLAGALAVCGACDGGLDGSPAGPSGTSRNPPGPGARSPNASVSGARRLSQAELDRTLFDLLGDDTRPARRLLAEDEHAPFDNDYTLQRASRALIESVEALAEDVAARAVASPAVRARIVPCTPSSAGDEVCFRAFVRAFVGRALRRPLTDADVERYLPLLAFATEDQPHVDNDFWTAVDLVIRAVLQDPEFLYRIEVGERTDEAGVFALSDHEIATRMAYLLWASTPDDALLADASAGRLRSEEGRRAAAERMMDDVRAREQVRRFHSMWLGYRSIPHSAERAAAFDRETGALIDRVVFDGERPYTELFASEETFVDADLAAHYGLPAPSDPAGAWVRYPGESGRAGILSHGSVLAAFSKFTDTSPTQRGIFVRTRLMCDVIAPPPPSVDVDQPPGGEDDDLHCKSDRYAMHRDMSTSCASCHAQMDPIGFGLEAFDVAGRLREHDEGRPECTIDGVGELPGAGVFSGPAELSAMLIERGEIEDCVVRQIWELAVGRDAMANERAAIEDAIVRFQEGGLSLRQLLIELVASPRFALRAEE